MGCDWYTADVFYGKGTITVTKNPEDEETHIFPMEHIKKTVCEKTNTTTYTSTKDLTRYWHESMEDKHPFAERFDEVSEEDKIDFLCVSFDEGYDTIRSEDFMGPYIIERFYVKITQKEDGTIFLLKIE